MGIQLDSFFLRATGLLPDSGFKTKIQIDLTEKIVQKAGKTFADAGKYYLEGTEGQPGLLNIAKRSLDASGKASANDEARWREGMAKKGEYRERGPYAKNRGEREPGQP